MSERAVEDWLANATERSYQTAFCHLLNAMGYAVIHSTSHGPGEQGKDVIARDGRGKIWAFQLKRGNITVPTWRRIRDEIVELVEQPVRHPSIGRRKRHYPVLVTNGYINENVGSLVDGQNTNWRQRGYRELRTWAGSELLTHFKKHVGCFLPEAVPEFYRLLGLMISDGEGFLNKSEFDLLLRSILPFSNPAKEISKLSTARIIRASAVIAEYALAGFDRANNHFAKIEAYTMLFCCIRGLAQRLNLAKKFWNPTVQIIEGAVDECARKLVEETNELGGFGQGNPFTEPIVAPYRRTLLGGAIAAHGLWCMLGGRTEWYQECKDSVVHSVLECSKRTILLAESLVPAIFLASEYLRHNGEMNAGNAIFLDILRQNVHRKQTNKNTKPLWGAYLPIEEAILRDLGKKEESLIRERWELNSYTAHALILEAACRLLRQDLESMWYEISSLHLSEFVAQRDWQMMLWNNKKGTMFGKVLPRPQSWRDLRHEAQRAAILPKAFIGRLHWLPYFLLVYPHRFTPGRVLALCSEISHRGR